MKGFLRRLQVAHSKNFFQEPVYTLACVVLLAFLFAGCALLMMSFPVLFVITSAGILITCLTYVVLRIVRDWR